MTPEDFIAFSFSIPLQVSILPDQVVLRVQSIQDAATVIQHCDCLIPTLNLVNAPLQVILYCIDRGTIYEIAPQAIMLLGLLPPSMLDEDTPNPATELQSQAETGIK